MRNKVANERTTNIDKYYDGIVNDMVEHDNFNINQYKE